MLKSEVSRGKRNPGPLTGLPQRVSSPLGGMRREMGRGCGRDRLMVWGSPHSEVLRRIDEWRDSQFLASRDKQFG